MNFHLQEVDIIGKLADLKLEHYKNTLAISAVIELLIDKGVITREEVEAKAKQLDQVIPGPGSPTR
ncbi:hypothetical protein [Paenibacillus senegalensis]|uniref:hypothetical protein n=1 Tax=Paenibacillus senegalensis TaxID=1465766 RepID=UPI0002888110|nr:hypothetical protein [Paenibacillus senegalensis]